MKRVIWKKSKNNNNIVHAYNMDGEKVGSLRYERVGAYIHWCWYQVSGIRMSPGCLQEVRDKQKELLREKQNIQTKLKGE